MWYAESDYFPGLGMRKWSLSAYHNLESEHSPEYGTRNVNTFLGMVHGKWIEIREYLFKISAKIGNILWGKTRTRGLSIHERNQTLKNLLLHSLPIFIQNHFTSFQQHALVVSGSQYLLIKKYTYHLDFQTILNQRTQCSLFCDSFSNLCCIHTSI